MIANKRITMYVLILMKENVSMGVFRRSDGNILELSRDELVAIFEAARGHPAQLLIRILWETGMQVREAVALTVGDVDTVHRKIRIVNTREACLRRGEHRSNGKRGKPERDIALPSVLYYPLCRAVHGRCTDEFLFFSRDPYCPFNARTIEILVRQLGRRLRIDGLTASAFRDTFILHNLRNGTSRAPLQRHLGFLNRQPFKRYESYLGRGTLNADQMALSLEMRA
ncbi:MAG: hypothetical protein CMN76_08055 [Spirochaetaceae bacterium]|nr:hypothetical protein [Spirochaetaceae bacterium]|tara:strand:- start:16679 stop:17356 length:678 start_codon:yes stop_codon:yes gene_type:complete